MTSCPTRAKAAPWVREDPRLTLGLKWLLVGFEIQQQVGRCEEPATLTSAARGQSTTHLMAECAPHFPRLSYSVHLQTRLFVLGSISTFLFFFQNLPQEWLASTSVRQILYSGLWYLMLQRISRVTEYDAETNRCCLTIVRVMRSISCLSLLLCCLKGLWL